jgi:hypothetical protein
MGRVISPAIWVTQTLETERSGLTTVEYLRWCPRTSYPGPRWPATAATKSTEFAASPEGRAAGAATGWRPGRRVGVVVQKRAAKWRRPKEKARP